MFYKSLRYGLKEIFNTLICECIALLQLILPCALLSVTNGIAKAHWNILLSSPLYQHRLKRDCYLKVLITTEFDLLCLPFLQNTKVGRGERENLSKVVGTGVKSRIIHTLSRYVAIVDRLNISFSPIVSWTDEEPSNNLIQINCKKKNHALTSDDFSRPFTTLLFKC